MPDDYCSMMKVQFLANAKFKYNLYINGSLDLKPEEEIKMLKNIKAVQSLAE